jgi:hypothetical protein
LNRVSKNLSFHTDFKNVHKTFVKGAHKKSFAPKTDFLGLKHKKFSIGKIVFIALPKFYAPHLNYEILSKSLIPRPLFSSYYIMEQVKKRKPSFYC